MQFLRAHTVQNLGRKISDVELAAKMVAWALSVSGVWFVMWSLCVDALLGHASSSCRHHHETRTLTNYRHADPWGRSVCCPVLHVDIKP